MSSSGSHRVTYIVLRYMRRPLLLLVSVYAVSMVGWVLIPGPQLAEDTAPLSFFHAFYFMTYTATTTGFGEIPYEFTEQQRMWGILSLYAGVLTWFYAVGSIIGLIQNPHFKQAISERRFEKIVASMHEPFVIACGFGNTGSLLARGLSDAGMAAVILDADPDRIRALQLRDYRVEMPGLCADARVPDHLISAGLLKPNCRAVVALTPDEDVNLKIAVSARLLNPAVMVISRSTSASHEETLASLGGDVHIIDPFHTYARYLGVTIRNPLIHTLNQWLSGSRDARLDQPVAVPQGDWVLCGFGRMGRAIHQALSEHGVHSVAIEQAVDERHRDNDKLIIGRANRERLIAAGAADAVGIVAGTNSDSENLSILLNARAVNPQLYSVVRQNKHHNARLFQSAEVDFIMQPSLVSARRILFLLTAPLLKGFIEHLHRQPAEYSREVSELLLRRVGADKPKLWSVVCSRDKAMALNEIADAGGTVCLDDLLRHPHDREHRLACVPLVIRSGGAIEVLPALSRQIQPGDELLFCGRDCDIHLLDASLNNPYTLGYLISGRDEIRSSLLRWLFQRREHSTS